MNRCPICGKNFPHFTKNCPDCADNVVTEIQSVTSKNTKSDRPATSNFKKSFRTKLDAVLNLKILKIRGVTSVLENKPASFLNQNSFFEIAGRFNIGNPKNLNRYIFILMLCGVLGGALIIYSIFEAPFDLNTGFKGQAKLSETYDQKVREKASTENIVSFEPQTEDYRRTSDFQDKITSLKTKTTSKQIKLESKNNTQKAIVRANSNNILPLKKNLNSSDHSNKKQKSTVSQNSECTNAVDCLNRGKDLIKKGLDDRAIACFDRAIKYNPQYLEAYQQRGVALKEIGKTDKAIQDFDKVIRLDPFSSAAYIHRGLAMAGKKQYYHAIADFNQALELTPRSAEPYCYKAIAWQKKGNLERAFINFEKAIYYNASYDEAYFFRGMAYIEKGDMQKALNDFNKALKLNKNYASAYYHRSLLWKELGNKRKEAQDRKKAIKIDPLIAKNYKKKNGTSKVNEGREKNKIPKHMVIEALKLVKEGIDCSKKGNYDGAITKYESALKLVPSDAETHYFLGYTWLKKGKYERALASFKNALKNDPKNIEYKDIINRIEEKMNS